MSGWILDLQPLILLHYLQWHHFEGCIWLYRTHTGMSIVHRWREDGLEHAHIHSKCMHGVNTIHYKKSSHSYLSSFNVSLTAKAFPRAFTSSGPMWLLSILQFKHTHVIRVVLHVCNVWHCWINSSMRMKQSSCRLVLKIQCFTLEEYIGHFFTFCHVSPRTLQVCF